MLRDIENSTWTRLVLIAIGAISGFVEVHIVESWRFWRNWRPDDTSQASLIIGISFFAFMAFLTLRRDTWLRDAGFSVAIGVFAGGFLKLVDYFKGGGLNFNGTNGFAMFLSLAAIAIIPVVFYQTGRDAGGWRFPYAKLFLNSWQNKIVVLVAIFFTSVSWLMLYLSGQLFKLIGIMWVTQLIGDKLFVGIFTSAAIGLGVALARERPKVITALLNLVLILFRVLAPFLAGIIIVFLLTMGVTGIGILWDTDLALPIFTTSIFLFVLFVNAVIQTGADDNKFWKFGEWLMMVGTFSLPILAVLAAWGLSLRVAQYGWTPPRIYSAVLVSIGLAYGIAYAFCVIWKRNAWKQGITRINPPFACLVLLLAIAIQLPPWEPFKLSAEDQVARLKEKKISPEDFDFAYLKFKLGEPGQKALDEIKSDKQLMADEQIAGRIATLETVKYYPRTRAQRQKILIPESKLAAIGDYMVVYPVDARLPEAMMKPKHDFFKRELRNCTNRDSLKHRQCIFLKLDVNSDGRRDIGLITGKRNMRTWLQQEAGAWAQGPTLNLTYKKGQKVTLKSLAEAVKADKIELKPRAVKDVIIGGVRFQ